MTVIRMGVIAVAMFGATALSAARDEGLRSADHNGAPELVRGDYIGAERVLTAARLVAPRDADLLLNQALLYQRSGRADAARDLYRQVLTQPDDQMLLAGGRWHSAHALARAGLRAGGGTVIATR